MPGTRDGFDLARWVQEHRPEIPVILTSGLARTAELSHHWRFGDEQQGG
jgi:phosphohistidine phosphatase SixA